METDIQLIVSKHHEKIEVSEAVSVENRMYGLEGDKKIHPTIWSEEVKINWANHFRIKNINLIICITSRKSIAEKKIAKPDPIYRNRLVNMLVNRILKNGKKSLAYGILYKAVGSIKRRTKKNPLFVLRQAIGKVTPDVTVKARRMGGSTYQVPLEIGSAQGKALAIRWLLEASRKRSGRSMALKLSYELIDAAKNSGIAVRKREETHRMAEANRAFAHFR